MKYITLIVLSAIALLSTINSNENEASETKFLTSNSTILDANPLIILCDIWIFNGYFIKERWESTTYLLPNHISKDAEINHSSRFKDVTPITDAMEQIAINLGKDSLEGLEIVVVYYSSLQESNKEKIIDKLFTKHKVKSIFMVTQSILTLKAKEFNTALILNGGSHFFSIAPYYLNRLEPSSTTVFQHGFVDLFIYLKRLLKERDDPVELNYMEAAETFARIGRVAESRESAKLKSAEPLEVKLMNGKTFTVTTEGYRVCELLFSPDYVYNGNENGLGWMVYKAISRSDILARKTLYYNILIDPAIKIPGMEERLKWEVKKFAPPTMDVDVTFAYDSLYKGLVKFLKELNYHRYIFKDEYDNLGKVILNEKLT